jgi:hypothetical protein
MEGIATSEAARRGPLPAQSSAAAVIIQPSRGWVSLRLRELWEYRDLFLFLAWRDISVRYKQTILGAAWAIIQPVTARLRLVWANLVGVLVGDVDCLQRPWPRLLA